MTIDSIKANFPIFETNPGLVYLDNAATTHKPHTVIKALVDFYTHLNSNVHRGIYPLSEAASEAYELARHKVAKFIGAAPAETIFTAGTTDGLNLLAAMLANSDLVPSNPVILTTEAEHHSNILPWQQISNQINYIVLDQDLQLSLDDEEMFANADIVALSLVSNVTGAMANIKRIRNLTRGILIVDAAQAVAHYPLNVPELGIDFLVFGGHKMYGPMGIGVLYGKQELLEKLPPTRVGGGMINKVDRNSASWAPLPERLEAGTPSVADAIGLAAAIDFMESISWDKIRNHEKSLSKYTVEQLSKIAELQLYHAQDGVGVFSFTVEGVHPHDLAQVLGEERVCVRAGHHCTQILHREVLRIPASTRASLAIYNDESDIDKLYTSIQSAISKFSR